MNHSATVRCLAIAMGALLVFCIPGRISGSAPGKAGNAAARFSESHEELVEELSGAATRLYHSASVRDGVTTTTDLEFCFACQVAVGVALEHLDEHTDIDEAIFVHHSACYDQPPIMEEGCDEIIRLDAQIAQQILVTRSVSLVCAAAGMCAR